MLFNERYCHDYGILSGRLNTIDCYLEVQKIKLTDSICKTIGKKIK